MNLNSLLNSEDQGQDYFYPLSRSQSNNQLSVLPVILPQLRLNQVADLSLELTRLADSDSLYINEFLSVFGDWICAVYDYEISPQDSPEQNQASVLKVQEGKMKKLKLEELLVRLLLPLLPFSDLSFSQVVKPSRTAVSASLPLSEYNVDWVMQQFLYPDQATSCCSLKCSQHVSAKSKGKRSRKRKDDDDDEEFTFNEMNNDASSESSVDLRGSASSSKPKVIPMAQKLERLIALWLDNEYFGKYVSQTQTSSLYISNLSLGQDRLGRHYYVFSHSAKVWLRDAKLDEFQFQKQPSSDIWFCNEGLVVDLLSQLQHESEQVLRDNLQLIQSKIGSNMFDTKRIKPMQLTFMIFASRIANILQQMTLSVLAPHVNKKDDQKYMHFRTLLEWHIEKKKNIPEANIEAIRSHIEEWYRAVTFVKKQRKQSYASYSPLMYAFSDHEILEVSASDLKNITQSHQRWLSLIKESECVQQLMLYVDLLQETILSNIEGEPLYEPVNEALKMGSAFENY